MLNIIKRSAAGLLATQLPSGYIGNYKESAQLTEWDIWGRKYTLLGLLAYYDLTGDKTALKGSCRLADNLLSQVGPGKVNIVKTGNYLGMPSSSILEPMVYLYRRTGDKKYLDFAKYIVEQWETKEGPKLISSALAGIAVSERFPHPDVWWSYDNGQKAYEMMSCYEGLLELYRITGEPSYLKAVEMAVKNIIATEINIAGSGTAFECFYNGARYQTDPTYHTMETCVTMTWMKLCFNLLRLTENPESEVQLNKGNRIKIDQSSKYPATPEVNINIMPQKPENFTISFRIPQWSRNTVLTINGEPVEGIVPGTYKKITRTWNCTDQLILKLDLTGRLITQNGYQAIMRGPVVLARDTRFGDGFIYESAEVKDNGGNIDLIPSSKKPADVFYCVFTRQTVHRL